MELIDKIKQFFCKHKHEIAIVRGMENLHSMYPSVEMGEMEVICYCSKCNKIFIKRLI